MNTFERHASRKSTGAIIGVGIAVAAVVAMVAFVQRESGLAPRDAQQAQAKVASSTSSIAGLPTAPPASVVYQGAASTPSAAVANPYPLYGSPMTADQAVAAAEEDTVEVSAGSTITVTATTLATLTGVSGPGKGQARPPASLDLNRPVWAVTVVGTFYPEFGRGSSYQWGMIAYDQATGAPVATYAGNGVPPTISG